MQIQRAPKSGYVRVGHNPFRTRKKRNFIPARRMPLASVDVLNPGAPFEIVVRPVSATTYLKPSTNMMSPSECSIPEKRMDWPSGARLDPHIANR